MMKQEGNGKQGPPMGPEAVRVRIMGLDTKTMGKMDAAEFMLLREGADFEGQKKLDYLFNRMEIENLIRVIVKEELAKLSTPETRARAARARTQKSWGAK